jgi:glycosyltransferase involved in cell wall biosynthesis
LQDQGLKPWKLGLVKLLDRLTHKLASPVVHAVTRSAALNASEHLHLRLQDMTVVYRGRPEVQVNMSRQQLRHSLQIPDNAFVFIHVARQEHQKNHLGLITAFEQVLLEHPGVRLLFVGRDGNTSAAVQQRLSNSPARDAIMCMRHRTDVAELLRCSDAFVLPSHFEGLSGAMIEAMEAGLPVICSDLDGLREGCEPDRSALLCDPKRPETIASSMDRLLDDRDLAHRLGARGRQIFLERFTLEASCQGMLSFFESVMAQGNRAGHSAH